VPWCTLTLNTSFVHLVGERSTLPVCVAACGVIVRGIHSVSTGVRVNPAVPEAVGGPVSAAKFQSAKPLPDSLRLPVRSPARLQRLWSPVRSRAPLARRPLLPTIAVGGRIKRLVDIVIAGSVLFATTPLLLIVAACLRLTIGGPVLFSQRRVGLGGEPFSCLKFRTMVINGDEVLRRHFQSNPGAAREWAETQKLREDPRVTRLGHVLRKSSIDELPQLLNVLRGEMSCIGPRPIVATELDRYQSAAHEYMAARPGLTGLWQVSGRNRVSYRQRVGLDRVYVRRWSLGLDAMILVRTIGALTRWNETS
jgi:exopolysaccharide production protein ExoY